MREEHLIGHDPAADGIPLCLAYDVVQMRASLIETRSTTSARTLAVIWAVGVHRSGYLEAIGSWLVDRTGAMDWRALGASLADRGLRRIGYLGSRDFEDVALGIRQSIAVTSAGSGRQSTAAVAGINGRLRAQRMRTVNHVARIDRALSHASTTRAPFDCGGEALAVFRQVLGRFERRLWAERAAPLMNSANRI
jgi:hypothetical protein